MANNILVTEEPRGASEIIEIPVASGVSRVTLPDVPQLRNQGDQVVILKAMRLITAKVLTNGPTSGTANAAVAELKKISLVLYSAGWEKGHLIPLLVLNDVADADATTATTIPYRRNTTRFSDWQDVDWNKSFLQYSSGLTSSGAYVVIFEVEYVRYQKQAGTYQQIN